MYTTYGCGTQKKKGGSCPAKDIREDILRTKCTEVLGLTEFDDEVFSTQVEKIVVPEQGVLVFHMTDGRVIRTKWKSTAKKDAWTPERRAAKGRLVQERQLAAHSSCFTSRIHCDLCGENYRRQRTKRVDGSYSTFWRCASASKCHSTSISEDSLLPILAQALGTDGFDETAFRERVAGIHITGLGKLAVHFKDGHIYEAEWKNKRKMPKQTEERKAHMSMKMKENWRKRRGESNDHSGNDQPVHSNAN